MVPFYKKCANYPGGEVKTFLSELGWPSSAESVDYTTSTLFGYLQDAKHQIRLDFDKAKTGGKKGKKKGKGGAAPEEAKPIDSVAIFVGLSFLPFQKKVLEIMSGFEFDADNVIQGDYIKAIRECQDIGKKEMGLALKFAAFKAKEAETIGKNEAFATEMPFDEVTVINENHNFLFENMPQIKIIKAYRAEGDSAIEALPGQDQVKIAAGGAVPGKPTSYFFAGENSA